MSRSQRNAAFVEVPMVDLYETNDPKYAAQIDGVGWIFVAFAVVIAATAAMALSWTVLSW
jgi:hypothetical protein